LQTLDVSGNTARVDPGKNHANPAGLETPSSSTRRIRFQRSHKIAESTLVPFIASAALIVERDDGLFQLGLADEGPGPFPSRRFAEAVRLRGTRHQARWLQQ
jgi:hypothetical protein